jgi:hypothetical protein
MNTVAKRAMNNTERAQAAELKKNGFLIFWEGTERTACYWATHPKLIGQYALGEGQHEATKQAIDDLLNGKLHRHTSLNEEDLTSEPA